MSAGTVASPLASPPLAGPLGHLRDREGLPEAPLDPLQHRPELVGSDARLTGRIDVLGLAPVAVRRRPSSTPASASAKAPEQNDTSRAR